MITAVGQGVIVPELPEVETVVRDLRDRGLIGQVLVNLRVVDDRLRLTADGDLSRYDGQRLVSIRRRGKFIIYEFDNGYLVQHLRMTGKMVPWLDGTPASMPIRFVAEFENGAVAFHDVRRFGTLDAPTDIEDWDAARNMAPEMIGVDDISPARSHFLTRLRATGRPVKSALLDQSIACGVGNIYADEGCHAAGIHPRRAGNRISERRATRLFDEVRNVMQQAIDKRGTTMSDYFDVNGNPGVFRKYLNVYKRAGLPCKSCGHAEIQRIVVGGRSTHFCGSCQR